MHLFTLFEVAQHGPPDWTGGMGLPGLGLLVAVVVISVSALLFLFPRLERVRQKEDLKQEVMAVTAVPVKTESSTPPEKGKGNAKLEAAMRTLQTDEKRIVELLVKSGGTILQKEISQELGLSRVKTHRVLVRLVGRGVVRAEKYYNTNRITLSDWLLSDS